MRGMNLFVYLNPPSIIRSLRKFGQDGLSPSFDVFFIPAHNVLGWRFEMCLFTFVVLITPRRSRRIKTRVQNHKKTCKTAVLSVTGKDEAAIANSDR